MKYPNGNGKAKQWDFVVGLRRTQIRFDSIWFIVNRLTKSANFLPVKANYPVDRFARLYMREIVRLHGAPLSIVLDMDPKFSSRFLEYCKGLLGLS